MTNKPVPEDATQSKNGGIAHNLYCAAIDTQTPQNKESWQAFLQVITQRQALATDAEPYHWKRDDAYEHLK